MTLYSFRPNKHGSLVLAKWETDGERPDELYTITQLGKGHCDCIGSSRKPYCKHRQLVDEILALHEKDPSIILIGAFYDFDRKLLYTPTDGEGIPIAGVVTIEPLGDRYSPFYGQITGGGDLNVYAEC